MKEKRKVDADLDQLIPILIGVWRRFSKLSGPPDRLQTREFRSVVEGVKQLQEGLDGSLVEVDYFKERSLLGSYLLYYWVIHYLEGLSLMGEIPFSPNRVLDLCSGPAPLAFAALKQGAKDVIAVERNLTALNLGAEVAGRYGFPLSIREADCLKILSSLSGKFDLITIGRGLSELFPASKKGWLEQQESFIHSLFSYLKPEGAILLVEDSLPVANRRLLQLRDQLVNRGVPIQAPCVWQGSCPALQEEKGVCYAQREMEKPFLIKEIQRAAQINLSSLKMSYLIVRHPEAGWPKLPEVPLYRVVSPPFESFGGKRFQLCGIDGKKTIGSHLKEHPKDSKAFEYLKRGELISIEKGLEKANGWDIVEGTKVVVQSPCGKPLPEREA